MSIRLMASPPVAVIDPVLGHVIGYRAKAEQYCNGFINSFPTKLDGTPASSWVLTFGRAADWTAADADPQITRVFSHPSNDVATVKTTLQNMTLGDLSVAERTRLAGVFAALEVPTSDIPLTTPLERIRRRLIGWLMDKDEHLGARDNF